MNHFKTTLSAVVLAGAMLSPAAHSSDVTVTTLNPQARQKVLVLENGTRITMDGTSETLSIRSLNGQTFTFTFNRLAREISGIPSEQSRLVHEWRQALSEPGNAFAITGTYEPTLALAGEAPRVPRGSIRLQGMPGDGVGEAAGPGDMLQSQMSMPSGSGPEPCAFVPCSCTHGECRPAYGFPGLGMMYFTMLDGGSGRESKTRQSCQAAHYQNWHIRQQAQCASINSSGWTSATALGTTVATCGMLPITTAAGALPCAVSFVNYLTTAMNYIKAHQACRSTYPGPGNSC